VCDLLGENVPHVGLLVIEITSRDQKLLGLIIRFYIILFDTRCKFTVFHYNYESNPCKHGRMDVKTMMMMMMMMIA